MQQLQMGDTMYVLVEELPSTAAEAVIVECEKCTSVLRAATVPSGTPVCMACFALLQDLHTASARGFRFGV